MTTTPFNLFDISYRVARELGIVIEGTATAGATTSITDTVGLLGTYEDDWWNNGTAWIIWDLGGAGAAPQGEFARISDFVKATGVATITPALTAAVVAGDRYGLATKEYPRDIIIQHINQVLGEIPVLTIDDATITTAADITEYDLPAGMLDQDIEVWINTNDVTDNNYWVQRYDWYIQESATGTQKVLVFRNQPEEPYHIRIKYWKPHTPLYASTDKLRESIDINRVVLAATYRLLLWKKAQKNTVDPYLDTRLAELYPRVRAAEASSPARKDYIKLNTYGLTDNFGGS